MSRVEVVHGDATVVLEGIEVHAPAGTSVRYTPRDLMDATAAALLAVNTPQAVEWAHALYGLTAVNLGPRRAAT